MQNELRKYRVVIQQPMLTAIIVEAVDSGAAEELACEKYMDGPASEEWEVDYGEFSVGDCDLLDADAPAAEQTEARS